MAVLGVLTYKKKVLNKTNDSTPNKNTNLHILKFYDNAQVLRPEIAFEKCLKPLRLCVRQFTPIYFKLV